MRGGMQNHLRLVAPKDFLQALLILHGTHAKNQPRAQGFPVGVAVGAAQVVKQVVHVVFADVQKHHALRGKRQKPAAQLASDGSSPAGDQHRFATEEIPRARHVQLLLRAAQKVVDVDVAHLMPLPRAGPDFLRRMDAAHAATRGHAFFNQGFQVAPRRGDGDDDVIHLKIAGQLENIARSAQDRHAADASAVAGGVVVHHQNRHAMAVAATLHFVHHVRPRPARANDHHPPRVGVPGARHASARGDRAVQKPRAGHQAGGKNP